jgi:hypothetical protein
MCRRLISVDFKGNIQSKKEKYALQNMNGLSVLLNIITDFIGELDGQKIEVSLILRNLP